MEYRTLGRTGLEVSAIGLGMEHMLKHSPEEMAAVLDAAVAGGITYIDLLYEGGEFWAKFGSLLRAYQDKFCYAAHWGGPNDYEAEYCKRSFEGMLEALGADHVPIAMITMVDTMAKWRIMRPQVEETMLGYKEQGVIGAIAVSGHHGPTAVKMIQTGLIDVLMHPVGLTAPTAGADKVQAPDRLAPVFAACQEQGVGLVAMKAYAGGMLLNPQHSQATPVQCLHYVLSQPVATVAVGVQSADEVRAALEYYTCPEEAREYGPASETLALHDWDACTQCLHCLPCPNGLDVPEIMRLAFMARWKLSPAAELRAEYAALQAKASDCEECHTCLERCAFGVDIMERMATAREVLEG